MAIPGQSAKLNVRQSVFVAKLPNLMLKLGRLPRNMIVSCNVIGCYDQLSHVVISVTMVTPWYFKHHYRGPFI